MNTARRPLSGQHRLRSRSRRAFTLVELLVVVFIIGTLATVALTRFSLGANRAEAAAHDFAADVAFAQAEAAARPDLGCILKLDPAQHRYWLARPASPDIPITHPITRRPYVVSLGSHATGGAKDVLIDSYALGGDTAVSFDALGGLDQTSDAEVTLRSAGVAWTVRIAAASGIVSIAPTDDNGAQTGGFVNPPDMTEGTIDLNLK